MALLRIEDSHGGVGWGEIWGNFPSFTIEHRATLAAWALPDNLIGAQISTPSIFCEELAAKLRVLKVQSAEDGPVNSVVAATNQALWDLSARNAGMPLQRLLRSDAPNAVAAYSSGLNPKDCVEVVERERQNGYRAFKLKIGFDGDIDQRNLSAIRAGMQTGERLFVDANQRFSLAEARQQISLLEEMAVDWWEEPMIADAPADDWRTLNSETSIPLAGGENLLDMADFRTACEWFAFMQPDIGKWGGVDGCLEVARMAAKSGAIYCPHWLAGGVGLMHSANLLAAASGDGVLEVDSNDNPLRTTLIETVPGIDNGLFHLNDEPGIGIDPPVDQMATWLKSHETFH